VSVALIWRFDEGQTPEESFFGVRDITALEQTPVQILGNTRDSVEVGAAAE